MLTLHVPQGKPHFMTHVQYCYICESQTHNYYTDKYPYTGGYKYCPHCGRVNDVFATYTWDGSLFFFSDNISGERYPNTEQEHRLQDIAYDKATITASNYPDIEEEG